MFLGNVLSLLDLLLLLTEGATSFTIPINHRQPRPKAQGLAAAVDRRYEAAAVKLTWETLEESSARPVLNLSQRDDSPENLQANEKDNSSFSSRLPTETWDEQWNQETLPGLRDLGILADKKDNDGLALLDKCPQLLRLPPAMILETATWLVEKFSPRYVAMEPRLLSYRCHDVAYGVEFLGTMMMMTSTANGAMAACAASPAFLLSGIQGGIQERAVEKALGAAGSATSAANQKIAGDAIQAWNQIQERKRKGL